MDQERGIRVKELRETSHLRRLRIEELRRKLNQREKSQPEHITMELKASLVFEEELLQRDQDAIRHLELADFYISNYVGRMNNSAENHEAIEESSTDEARLDKRISSEESSTVLEGDLENSQTWDMVMSENEELQRSTTFDVEETEPGPGILSKAVGGVVSLFSWTTPSMKSPTVHDNDFSVVHANWYGRRLNRVFRFCNDVFLRINPDNGEIRQAYKYSDVEKVVVKNPSAIVIHYRDNLYPADWIEASPSKITRMLDIVDSKLKSLNIEREYA